MAKVKSSLPVFYYGCDFGVDPDHQSEVIMMSDGKGGFKLIPVPQRPKNGCQVEENPSGLSNKLTVTLRTSDDKLFSMCLQICKIDVDYTAFSCGDIKQWIFPTLATTTVKQIERIVNAIINVEIYFEEPNKIHVL